LTTQIEKRSTLHLIAGAQIGTPSLLAGEHGTWPAMISAGDVPAAITRWAALLNNDHRKPPETVFDVKRFA
jgi:hypothetical protein